MTPEEKEMRALTTIQAKHADRLMTLQNVIGVAVGMKKVDGKTTDSKAIVVLVTEKVPESKLPDDEIVPKTIDGVLTDVQETGGMFTAGD